MIRSGLNVPGLPSIGGLGLIVPALAGILSWQIVGQYGEIGFNTAAISSGSERNFMQMPIDLSVDVQKLSVLSDAFYVDATSLPQPTANDLYVGHSYWTGGGVKLYEDASRTQVPAGSGGVVSSEFVGNLSAGARIWLHREVDTAAGGGSGYATIPYDAGAVPTGYLYGKTALTVNNLAAASPTVSPASYRMHPRAVLGYGVHGYTFHVTGDSIAYLNADTYAGDGGSVGVDGRTTSGGAWVRQAFAKASEALGKRLPLAMSARASAALTTLQSGTIARIRAIYPFVSCQIFQIGTNDGNGGLSALQIKTAIETEIAAYKAAFSAANPGITPKALVCTLLPRQAGNAASTLAGGAVSKPWIISYNAYVRSGSIAGADGYLDPNAAVADATDESMWARAGDNSDGTHPTGVGHTTISNFVFPTLTGSTPWLTFAGGGAGQMSVSVTASAAEGTSGAGGLFTVTVTRTTTTGAATVNFAVTGSGANPLDATDFGGTFPSGTVNFTSGSATGTATFSANPDATIEPDETGTVTISGASAGYTITTATANFTVTNDDASSFTPASLTSLVQGWDARNGATTGSSVPAAWGTSAALAITAPTTIPTVVTTNGVQSLSVVKANQATPLFTGIDLTAGDMEFWFVGTTASASQAAALIGSSAGAVSFITLSTATTLAVRTQTGASNTVVTLPSTLVTGTAFVLRLSYNKTAGTITPYVNGTAGTATTIGSNPTAGFNFNELLKWSTGNYFGGNLLAAALTNAILTGSDVTSMQSYCDAIALDYNT